MTSGQVGTTSVPSGIPNSGRSEEYQQLPTYSGTDLDYQRIVRAGKKLKLGESAPVIKLAILGDCSTQQLAVLIRVLLGEAGIRAEVYEGGFDAMELECCDPASALYRFAPDAIVILNSAQALRMAYLQQPGEGTGYAEDCLARISRIWDAIQANCSAMVLQSTFAIVPDSYFGNFELHVPTSLRSITTALNARLAAATRDRSGILLHDVEAVASWVGRREFFDERAWDLWKLPCSLDHLPRIAKSIVDVLLAFRGRVVKCVVVDLDNTLWGGVIGDDGLEGIALSTHGGGAGESFVRLQLYLRQLRRRGILLAVCSKNDEATALLPFLQHPDMVLKRDDISVFVANWDDKANGIRRVRAELNISLDSIVFLDDNVFERNLVRELLPEVIVPELPEDPSSVVAFLSELNLFETTSLSKEDLQRALQYQKEAERRESAARFMNVQEFLRSLDMQIVVSRFDRFHVPRIAQLMQRSNQFNLCTRRLSESECGALMQDNAFIPLYATLADRFGDHGLISVVVLERQWSALIVRDWLMSCRVLARGVEQFLMNHVVTQAQQLGLPSVIGEYIPTPKNGMVREFFQQFGFERVSAQEDTWVLDVSSYRRQDTFIHLAQSATSIHSPEEL
jgi:FkbH-like protein